ncbi:type I toxin-antitoxin system Ibs family toxin, partial [Escherichia coli]
MMRLAIILIVLLLISF